MLLIRGRTGLGWATVYNLRVEDVSAPITILSLMFLAKLAKLQPSLRLILFWGLCVVAVISFGVTFALSIVSAVSSARFFVALYSVATASAVQKYTLLEAVIILSTRRRRYSAILLETFLGSVPFCYIGGQRAFVNVQV